MWNPEVSGNNSPRLLIKILGIDRMPTANRDSSDLTRKRNAQTLYAWYSANKTAVNGGGVYREQPNTQTLNITTQRQLGACYCQDGLQSEFNGCGCGVKN
jgi:hypothetical protein